MLRDELQASAAPVLVSSWLWHLGSLTRDTKMASAWPLSVALVAVISVLLRFWVALCLLAGLLLGLELLYQSMRLRFLLPTLSLRRAMDEYKDASAVFEDLYSASLDLVKRAELATKGYRLGPRLPPLGRLENAATVRCGWIRLRLRWINEQMDKAASSGAGSRQPEAEESEDANQQQQSLPPSLLVTALSKRHALAALRIERVLFDAMHDAITALLQDRSKDDDQQSRALGLAATMKRQEQVYRSLTSEVAAWTLALEPLVRPAMALEATANTDASLPVGDHREARDIPKGVPDVRKSLQELRTACETLKALVFVCQHDTEAFASDLSEQPDTRRVEWLQQLSEARMLMQKMVAHVNSSWNEYERTLVGLEGDSSVASASSSEAGTKEILPRDEAPCASPVDLALVKDERDVTTVVFTGTSTGETDFDLMALLQRARLAPQNAAPDRSFVGELQDVLALRQRQASAPVTRQVDQDQQRPVPINSSSTAINPESKPVQTQAPSADMFQQELMARLRLQPSESIGDSDNDDALLVE